MHSIHWPADYLPGTTENFVSNEIIAQGLSATDIWPWLARATLWPGYYANSSDVQLHAGQDGMLAEGVGFSFRTFGFPVEASCKEFLPPAEGRPGRIAWHGWSGEPGSSQRLDVHHAWLIEDLDGDRVRILTQEVQKGRPAEELARQRPNPMLNGHQDWLDGLHGAALQARSASVAS
ncbi:polyketide cyclase [Comamonas testosteroni]|uniref:polyketide cyclase n=1 Tax=Comamonas testosteroni TaxID=285 RepID=UPI0005B2FE18|nr:polyketide cyclase [Comamonas testosteroni]